MSRYPAQRGRLDVEIAIVGGGFTGCLLAYAFATAGVRVALVERDRLGCGSAAASTALLMQEIDRRFTELAELYSLRDARTIWRLSRTAVRDLRRVLGPRNCGLCTLPSLHVAFAAAAARHLERDHRARRSAGLGGRLLSARALKRMAGLEGTAAILWSGDAVVDPYRATLALADAAQRAGASIFERSRAVRVAGRNDGAVITTPRGTVHSQWAIIATGFATPAFKPLASRFTMASTYVICTKRIPARDRARMGRERIMFWDAGRPYHYFRWTDDGRVLFGGGDRPVPRTPRARRAALIQTAEALERKLRELYPDVESLKAERVWEGLFATTPDGLPYIGTHRRYPRHLFALGYGGNGMTFASLAAQILLRHHRGRPLPSDALFGFQRTGRGRTGRTGAVAADDRV